MPTSFAPPSLWAWLVICQTNKQQAMPMPVHLEKLEFNFLLITLEYQTVVQISK